MQANYFVGVIRVSLATDTGREVSNLGLWEDLWGMRMK